MGNPDLIHLRVSPFRLKFLVQCLVLALKLGEVRVNRHEDPPLRVNGLATKVTDQMAISRRKKRQCNPFSAALQHHLAVLQEHRLYMGMNSTKQIIVIHHLSRLRLNLR
jgi:hypothetical protein